jgi:hypothetical protein
MNGYGGAAWFKRAANGAIPELPLPVRPSVRASIYGNRIHLFRPQTLDSQPVEFKAASSFLPNLGALKHKLPSQPEPASGHLCFRKVRESSNTSTSE